MKQLRSSIRFDSAEPVNVPVPVHAHLKPLDGLRGLAILLVIIPHLASSGMLPGPASIQRLAGTIGHGVDLFFVLSGFGLAFPLIEQRLLGRPVRLDVLTYAFNRIYRILPPYYLAIAFAYGVAALIARTGHPASSALLQVPHTLYETVAPLFLFDRANIPIDPGLWTIPIQMRWYLVFPLLLFVWMKSPRGFGVLIAGAWIAYMFTRTRTIDLGTIPLFMLGIVAAELIARRHALARYAIVLFPIAVAIALAWDPHAMIQDAWETESHFAGQPTSFAWHVVAFALVLIAATLRPAAALFSFKPLVVLGRASFSVYLVHQPVMALVLAKFGPRSWPIACAAILIAGFAFWWCVERPLVNAAFRRGVRERLTPAIKRTFAAVGIPRTIVYDTAALRSDTATLG